MKCYLCLFFAIAGAKKEKHVDETSEQVDTLQTSNSSEATFVGQFEQHFDLDGGVAVRSFVLALACLFIFMASCLLKRCCRKTSSSTRRYEMLEENQLNVEGGDSDSDLDIFQRTTKS